MTKEKEIINHLKQTKPYLFWRDEDLGIDEILTAIIITQDKEALKYLYDGIWFEKLKDILLKNLYQSYNTLESKQRFDRTYNTLIMYHKNLKINNRIKEFVIA